MSPRRQGRQGYYGGAPNAWQGGVAWSQDQRKFALQENALKALIGRYGPEAADPQSLAMLQSVEQREQLFPHTLSEAARGTAGAEANVDRYGAAAGTAATQGTGEAAAEQHRSILHRGVQALQMVRDRGGDLPESLQQFGTILQRIGMPMDELSRLQQQILTDPDSLDELATLLQDPARATSGRAISGGTPVFNPDTGKFDIMYMTDAGPKLAGYEPVSAIHGEERLGQGASRLNLGYQTQGFREFERFAPGREAGVVTRQDPYTGEFFSELAPGSPAAFSRMEKLEKMAVDSHNAIDVIQGRINASETVVNHSERALQSARTWRSGTAAAMARMAESKVWGSPMWNVAQNIQSVKDNIGIEELLRIKRAKAGLGHVPQKQLETLQSILGRMEVGRNPRDLVQDIQNAQRIFNQIVSGGSEDIERIRERMRFLEQEWGHSARGAPRQDQPQRQEAPAPIGPRIDAQPQTGPSWDLSSLSDDQLQQIIAAGGRR